MLMINKKSSIHYLNLMAHLHHWYPPARAAPCAFLPLPAIVSASTALMLAGAGCGTFWMQLV
jgi:hypothetical protein